MQILKKCNRVTLVIISMLIFSIIYLLLPDSDFSGVNNITELIRDEILKQKVRKDLQESQMINKIDNVSQDEDSIMKGVETFQNLDNNLFNSEQEEAIEEKVKNIEDSVEDEYTPENVNKSIFEQYFSRLYFSIITGCLLGYGDMYPVTARAKFMVMSQALITIIIIVL